MSEKLAQIVRMDNIDGNDGFIYKTDADGTKHIRLSSTTEIVTKDPNIYIDIPFLPGERKEWPIGEIGWDLDTNRLVKVTSKHTNTKHFFVEDICSKNTYLCRDFKPYVVSDLNKLSIECAEMFTGRYARSMHGEYRDRDFKVDGYMEMYSSRHAMSAFYIILRPVDKSFTQYVAFPWELRIMPEDYLPELPE